MNEILANLDKKDRELGESFSGFVGFVDHLAPNHLSSFAFANGVSDNLPLFQGHPYLVLFIAIVESKKAIIQVCGFDLTGLRKFFYCV